MTLTPPPTEDRTHPYQIFAMVFDHNSRMVSIDYLDPDNVGPAGVILNTRIDFPGNLNDEVRAKLDAVLSDACDLVAEALEFMPGAAPRIISPST